MPFWEKLKFSLKHHPSNGGQVLLLATQSKRKYASKSHTSDVNQDYQASILIDLFANGDTFSRKYFILPLHSWAPTSFDRMTSRWSRAWVLIGYSFLHRGVHENRSCSDSVQLISCAMLTMGMGHLSLEATYSRQRPRSNNHHFIP